MGDTTKTGEIMTYTQEERKEWCEKIMDLRERGHTYNDIAGILGKSRSAIQRLTMPFEPKERKKTKRISISAEEIRYLYHQKQMSARQIAQDLDVSNRQVLAFMARNKIERRGYSDAAKTVSSKKARTKHLQLRGTGKITNIYFLYAPTLSMVKIGRTSNVERRVKKINESSPVPLWLLKTISNVDAIEENRLHILFAAYRRRGEWFEVTGELAAYLEEYITGRQVAM